MRLDLAHRHAARIQRQDLVVEPCPTGLVLGDQLRLEAAVAIARDLEWQLAELALERLAAASVAGVAGCVGDRLVLVVTEVLGHLCIQCPLHQQLGQLLEQAVLANQVFRLLVVGQQAAEQLVGYLVLAWAHDVSGSRGSFPPVARLHKIWDTLRVEVATEVETRRVDIFGLRSHYFTTSINLPKLSTTSYLTFSGANRRFISSKNLRAHLILVFSISRSSIDDMDPLVSATK